MQWPGNPPPVCLVLSALLTFWPAAGLQGQLPSPARDAADDLLEVVRTGDRDRIRQFIEARFTPGFIDSAPMDQHVPIFASLGRQVEGLEPTSVNLDGPTRASLILEGPGRRLELRLTVESDPPFRIRYLGWGRAGFNLRANSLDDLGPELERLADRPPFSGVVLAAAGPEILFHEAYGAADLVAGRPNRPDTRFDIGSINKLFTATAILRLVQDGRLDLDDPMGQYLDGFPPDMAERITIRHLLQHRSGMGDYLTHPRFEANPKGFREPDDFLPLAREHPLEFEPGTRQSYSNTGFVVLGAIIERATGRGYHDVIQDLVFQPAGMTSAGPTGGGNAAVRYELQHGRFVTLDSLYADVATPAGGGYATAMDLRQFMAALLDLRLLDLSGTTLLLNSFDPATETGELPERFGFAGGAPGVNAIVLSRPAERTTVVVLANIDPVEVTALARRIEGLVLQR